MITKSKSRPREADLFEAGEQPGPQWKTLPAPIRQELLQMLREMLLSPPARELNEQIRKGGVHE